MKISADNLFYIAQKTKNIPRKLKREFSRIPPIHEIKEQAYQKALDDHSQFLPNLNTQQSLILETLKKEGTCIIPIEELQLSSTNMMMETVFALAHKLRFITDQFNRKDACEIGSSAEDLREFTEVLLWALEPKLLNIIENYIGLPVLYQGFAMRKSIADGQYSGVRQWHLDWEDRRIIKIIIYLNDVVAGGGAYEYISRAMTSEAIRKLNYYNLGYVSDEEMANAIPKSNWISCLAPQGTMIISDSSKVFHRAQPPTLQERFSVSFCYTSTMPQVMWNCREISQEQWEVIERNTNQRQKNCLHKKRFKKLVAN